MIKSFWNGLLTMFFISAILYAVGHVIREPLLMLQYELYDHGYLIERGSSMLPLLIGSFCAMIVGRTKRYR